MMRFIIAVIGFGIAGGVFMLYTKPAYDTVKSLQEEITQYDQALDRANELQARKQELLTRRNAFNPSDLDRLHKLLPDHVDNVRLILDFDNLASEHGLAIQNVVVGSDTDEAARSQITAVIGASARPYESLTLKFSTQGTYENFVVFMEALESSLRIVDMMSLTLSEAGVESDIPVYRFDVTLRTYWLK